MSEPTVTVPASVPDGWSDLTPEERAQLAADFAEADAEFSRGECIPADEVLPRYRRAG